MLSGLTQRHRRLIGMSQMSMCHMYGMQWDIIQPTWMVLLMNCREKEQHFWTVHWDLHQKTVLEVLNRLIHVSFGQKCKFHQSQMSEWLLALQLSYFQIARDPPQHTELCKAESRAGTPLWLMTVMLFCNDDRLSERGGKKRHRVIAVIFLKTSQAMNLFCKLMVRYMWMFSECTCNFTESGIFLLWSFDFCDAMIFCWRGAGLEMQKNRVRWRQMTPKGTGWQKKRKL